MQGEARELLEPLLFLEGNALPPLPFAPGEAPDRSGLAEELAITNRAFGHPRAQELAQRLKDPATRVVVTGQQAGLFGGPLYTLSKAVAAARWAAALEASGVPAVAVFWVATEDHDFDEVASATFLARQGPHSVSLGEDPQPLLPVGMRTLGPAVESLLIDLGEQIPNPRFIRWLETLARWYRPSARFGEAFQRLLPRLLGAQSPLMLDSQSPALKAAQQPWLERLVREREALDENLAAAHDAVSSAGLPLQIHPQPGVSPLFLLRGEQRRRIQWSQLDPAADRFSLRGEDGQQEASVETLLEALADNPGVVSPGALARPAIQDAVLGTTLQVLGPGELSYMVQAAGVHRTLGLPGAAVTLRPQALILDQRQLDHLQELKVPLELLLGDEGTLQRHLAQQAGAEVVPPAAQRIDEILAQLEGQVLAVDANLDRPIQRTRGQITKALEQLQNKVNGAVARGDEVKKRRLEGLREAVLPGGKLQERALSTAHFPGKYGAGLAEALWQQLDLDGRWLQVIVPDPSGDDA
ncbi:MAG: bacillithiol biosynthesis cysteine-adding enzyme BshC [Acidobacteriota bacterium]